MRTTIGRRLFGIGLLGCMLVAVGCSSKSNKLPISGNVIVDGAPGSLTVTFWSDDPSNGGRVMTDEKGQFTIGDKESGTGLAKGEYKVTVSRFLDKNGRAVHGGGKKSELQYETPSKESIPELYRDQNTTPISAKVASDLTSFTFEVSTKK